LSNTDNKKVTTPPQKDVAAYLQHLAAERRLPTNTLCSYGHDLVRLTQILEENGKSVSDATTDDVQGVIVRLRKQGLSASSVARNLSSWRV
jgi:integrase/recombinase XerC